MTGEGEHFWLAKLNLSGSQEARESDILHHPESYNKHSQHSASRSERREPLTRILEDQGERRIA
jgi:hypothetical protein